jgi:hypothetical protein
VASAYFRDADLLWWLNWPTPKLPKCSNNSTNNFVSQQPHILDPAAVASPH